MKNFKKLATLLLLAIAGLSSYWLISANKAYADDIKDLTQICVPPYTPKGDANHHQVNGWLSVTFTDRAHMTAVYKPNGKCASPATSNSDTFFGTATFSQILQNISGTANTMLLIDGGADSTIRYQEVVGGPGDDTRIDQFASDLDNLISDGANGHDKIIDPTVLKSKLTNAEITIGFEGDKVGYGCSGDYTNENFVLVDGNPPHWKCEGSGTSIEGEKGLIVGAANFSGLEKFNITYTVSTENNVLSVQSVFSGGQTFTYCTDKDNFRNNGCQGDLVLQATKAQITSLGTDTGQFNIKKTGGASFAVIVAGGQSPAASGTTGSGTLDSGSGETCGESSHAFPFAWVACPLLLAGQEIFDQLVNAFEGMLSFNVDQDLGNQQSQANVKKTWGLMRSIATALLVVIMLVMVFSQAVSAGPFDAYTVRKMLPRLVLVAIAIQLSWPLVSWVINLVDSIGKGIATIMYLPFGGAENLDLQSLLANAHINTVEAGVVSWVGIVGAIGLGIAALPATLLLIMGAIAAMATAWVTLILRKIIIICLLIFAPIALLAYILPNTQRYWKLWYDNLLKILFMFPLVVIMVSAGRIFAYIIGSQDSNTFLNFALIMVAFFGPLFLLPKTYKWGGQAMSLASGAIGGVTSRYAGRESALGKGLQGFGERRQGEIAKSYNPTARWDKRVRSRIGSGHIIPSPRNRRLAIAAGDKWSQERDEEALALIKRKGEKVLTDPKGYETALRMEDGREAVYKRMTNNEGVEGYMTKEGKFTTDKDKADKEFADGRPASVKTLHGVEAMKQMWVDLAEDGSNNNEKKMAIRQLTATSSWPEVQGSFTKSGKRVIDVDTWGKDIATSPEDYPRVLRSRVDAAPHLVDAANKEAAKYGYTGDETRTLDFKSANRINTAISKQMSNEDFATQSDGFWAEAERIANYNGTDEKTKELAQDVRTNLKLRFNAIQQAGGTAPQQMLSHLASGGKLQENVDKILGQDVNGQQISVVHFMNGEVGVNDDGDARVDSDAGTRRRSAQAPQAADTTSPPPANDEGEINVIHPDDRPGPGA